jgi:hypothetical protein
MFPSRFARLVFWPQSGDWRNAQERAKIIVLANENRPEVVATLAISSWTNKRHSVPDDEAVLLDLMSIGTLEQSPTGG